MSPLISSPKAMATVADRRTENPALLTRYYIIDYWGYVASLDHTYAKSPDNL